MTNETYASNNKEYIDGLFEFLDDLEEKLIELGRIAQDIEADHDALINPLFRAAHNMKSYLSAIEKPESARLMHSLENIFDFIRNGITIDLAEVSSTGLQVVDVLRENLTEDYEDENLISGLIADLAAIRSTPLPPEHQAVIYLNDTERQRYQNARIDKNFYQVSKQLTSQISREDFENLPVFEDIKEIGEIISIQPSFAQIQGFTDPVIKIYFASTLNREELQSSIFDPIKSIDTASFILRESPQAPVLAPTYKVKHLPQPVKILLLEDDFTTRMIIDKLLAGICEVHIGINGVEGLEALEEAYIQKEPYAVILLDLLMPKMNGKTFLNQKELIEQKYSSIITKKSPVIITSAVSEKNDLVKTFDDKFSYFLKKPIDRNNLLATIMTVLHET